MNKPTHIVEEAAKLKAIYQDRKRKDRTLTQEKVAEACGWNTQSTVSQYMNGSMELNLEALLKFAAALQFQPDEVSPRLASIYKAAQMATEAPNGGADVFPDRSGAISTGRLLPVIGEVQAGAFCEAIDNFQPGDADEWESAGGPTGPRAFILRVTGYSMYPKISPGDKVVIDPDMAFDIGHVVLARRVSDQSVTLKELRRDGSQYYLFASNPDWPDPYIKLNEEWHICGRARRKIVDL